MTTYSTQQVVDMIDGLTYRMIDNWVRRGYITPEVPAAGSGSRRRFTDEQVDTIRAKAEALALLDHPQYLVRELIAGRVEIRQVAR